MIPSLLPIYSRSDIVASHGEGPYLYTESGDKLLDFGAGIAVNALGHCHPHMVKAITEQATKLWHVSNLYQIPAQNRLAQRLVEASGADSVFFCNSGAEAIETAVKVTRRHFDEIGQPDKYRIITMDGGFHGRTMTAISAAGNHKVAQGFGPLLDGFDHVAFADIEAMRAAITDQTAAVMFETIQGEGGIREVPVETLQAIRQLCDEHGLLMIVDEVQCGTGRSGKFFAYQWANIQPDIITVAKGIGGGFPLGACLMSEATGNTMPVGSHGGTYGGNPMAMAAGNAVLDVVLGDGFLDHVQEIGAYFKQALHDLVGTYPALLSDVRGKGLMLGLVCGDIANWDLLTHIRAEGLLCVPAADNVLRIVPPLIITKAHVDEAMDCLNRACTNANKNRDAA